MTITILTSDDEDTPIVITLTHAQICAGCTLQSRRLTNGLCDGCLPRPTG